MNRNQYDDKLSQHLGIRYHKSLPGMYARLGQARQNDAKGNAQKLLKQYATPDPCRNDPSTTVFKLVEELNKYTPDSRR